MKIKNIFFDFDGVLADSVAAKTEAFRDIYLTYGKETAKKAVDHHIHNGGVSRYEKFKLYHKQFLNIILDEKGVSELAQKFSELVLNKVINSDSVGGSVAFLEKYHKIMDFWVITGTPTPEIEIIIKERKLQKYFKGLHGSPKNKIYWTEYLIDKFSLKREETLFIGDATTDFEAANYSKLCFALREHDENIPIFANYEGPRFSTFDEFEKKYF